MNYKKVYLADALISLLGYLDNDFSNQSRLNSLNNYDCALRSILNYLAYAIKHSDSKEVKHKAKSTMRKAYKQLEKELNK